MSSPFPAISTSRADWRAHRLIVGVWRIVIVVAAAWATAINVAFFAAVLREFTPELLGSIMRVLTRGS